MSAKSQPVRLEPEMPAFAKDVAERMIRSDAEQLSHWARIGREIELSSDVSVLELRQVLSGHADYDALSAKEPAVVRAAWGQRMEELRGALRLDEQFKMSGYRYAELDEHDEVITRATPPRGRRSPRKQTSFCQSST